MDPPLFPDDRSPALKEAQKSGWETSEFKILLTTFAGAASLVAVVLWGVTVEQAAAVSALFLATAALVWKFFDGRTQVKTQTIHSETELKATREESASRMEVARLEARKPSTLEGDDPYGQA